MRHHGWGHQNALAHQRCRQKRQTASIYQHLQGGSEPWQQLLWRGSPGCTGKRPRLPGCAGVPGCANPRATPLSTTGAAAARLASQIQRQLTGRISPHRVPLRPSSRSAGQRRITKQAHSLAASIHTVFHHELNAQLQSRRCHLVNSLAASIQTASHTVCALFLPLKGRRNTILPARKARLQ